MNFPWTIRWHFYLPQLLLICLGIIFFFAVCYWSIDTINWGWLLNRNGDREKEFLAMLYFSMGTFFRIGYGDQVPIGLSRWIVGLEAFSNYLIEVIFIARLVTSILGKFISFSIRERLEALLNLHE
jgi:hypothetical protein